MPIETPQQAARRLAAAPLRRGFKPVALHPYCDQEERPLYWRVRLKHPHTKEKWVRPLSRDEGGHFQLKEPVFPNGKPLYHLPELMKRPQDTVWVTEGELCAERLVALGLLATTSGGADSVTGADWTVLSGRTVVVWPDNDAAGQRYAQCVAQKLRPLGCQVSQVDVGLLGLPASGDCVDWLIANPRAGQAEVAVLPLTAPPLTSGVDVTEGNAIKTKHTRRLPSAFSLNEQGIFYHDEQGAHWVCSPLEIKALVRDNASENWGRWLSFPDADGALHTWAMPMEMLRGSGEELRGELLRLGVHIAPGQKARHLLMEYITTSHPATRMRCVARTGWHGPLFVLPHRTIGQCDETVIYQSESQAARHYAQAGVLAEWQQHVSAPCVGNTRLVLAVSCAFATLLLHPAGAESGGLHLVGESSCGKTTALRVAASVYGPPEYLQRWRATTNGLEALAALHSDTLFVLDELAQVDPKEAGEIAYMLANGSGKSRATKSGSARPRHAWRLLFLSAGEVGLTQHMQAAGKKTKAGQTVRLVDVPADAGKGLGLFDALHSFESGAALSKALTDAASQYYGTAAVSFLQHITLPPYFASLPTKLKILQAEFMAQHLPANASGQVHRVCGRFALVATAGELATEAGATGWQAGEASQAAAVCFQDWLAQRGNVGNQETAAFLAQVQAFFEAHGAGRFEDMGRHAEQRIMNRVGFKEKSPENSERYTYFVLPEMFKRELCAGFDPRWGARLLVQAGMIKPSSEGKAQTTHRLPGEGAKKCYHFIKTMPEKNFYSV